MLKEKRIAILLSSLLIMMVVAGCGSPKEDTSTPESSTEKNPCVNVESAVENWVHDNVDEISEELGALVTGNIPLARDIAAKAIETALLAWMEFSIEHLESIDGKCLAGVKLEFPLELKIPLVGTKGYRVSVEYDLIIEGGEVTDSDIDLSSFEMTEKTD